MKTLLTLPAHFDGNLIVLDTKFKLQANYKLLVTVLNPVESSDENNDWINSSAYQLNKIYSVDEPEYSISLIKEPNPLFKNERK